MKSHLVNIILISFTSERASPSSAQNQKYEPDNLEIIGKTPQYLWS